MLKVTAALQMFSSAASCFVLLYTNDSSITIPLSSRSLSLISLQQHKKKVNNLGCFGKPPSFPSLPHCVSMLDELKLACTERCQEPRWRKTDVRCIIHSSHFTSSSGSIPSSHHLHQSFLFFSFVFVLPVIDLSSPGYAFLPFLCSCNCKLYKQLSKLCNI